MAFGFGFNKQKVLSAAEKFVQQGKLQNAIAEYEKILKADAKDLTVANTVGDLYARLGESDKAIECFKSVGDAYATQGFTVKAIAMYKKITKIRTSLEGTIKLAELYTQQGLFNDARAQYLQVAEEFLRSGELEQAVRIFQKILEMDPENVAMRVRLAEVYVRLGKKNEAWDIFSAAAESLRSRGQLAGAEEILQRMTSLDPGNGNALLLRGRNAVESGDAEAAIKYLEKVTDLDTHPDGLRDLLKAYLQAGRVSEASTVAVKLLNVHNDADGLSSVADAMMQTGQHAEALAFYSEHCERMLAADSAKVLQNLHSIIGHVRDNPQHLHTLLDLFQRAGEETHVNEVNELLAHASVQGGELQQARDLYQKLAAAEPGNPLHMQNYEQVVSMMGDHVGSRLITAEEGAVIIDELEATASVIDQHYPDAVAVAIRSALTDADLFVSYNMPGKAVVPLLAVLPQAAKDVRLNQRLAALHTRAERFAEAAVCCRTLESQYSAADYPDEALRYGELAVKYEERAAAGSKSAAVDAVTEPASSNAQRPAAEAAQADADALAATVAEVNEFAVASEISPAEFAVQKTLPQDAIEPVDLSEEWESDLTVEGAPETEAAAESELEQEVPAASAVPAVEPKADASTIAETIEEIRFYLGHFMVDQARTTFSKLEKLTQSAALLANIRSEITAAEAEAATHRAVEEPEPEVEQVDTLIEPAPATEDANAETVALPEFAADLTPAAGTEDNLQEMVSDLEASLGDGFLPETVAEEVPAPAAHAQPESAPELETTVEHPAEAPPAGGVLGEFVSDLEESLGDGFLAEAPAAEYAEPAHALPPAPAMPATRAQRREPEPVVAQAAAASASAAASFTVPAMPVAAAAAPANAQAPVPMAVAAATAIPVPSSIGRVASKPAVDLEPTPAKFSAAGVDLAEMFGELKQDLEEETSSTDDDPETHYNLGVAFREMGLLDEAIGELQKVCQAVDHGHSFPSVMQTYTWLAQCFLDKGVPEAAIRWYEKALKLDTLDQETRTALHYELASSYEAAGDKASAIKFFMEVYGTNIDYRDVAERIKALKS
jgi:tetratricopeptide (TPR) repeat protein